MEKVLSWQRLRRVSKNGILLSSSNSMVNLMLSCRLFRKLETGSLALIVFAVKRGKGVIHISEANGRTEPAVHQPFFFKVAPSRCYHVQH